MNECERCEKEVPAAELVDVGDPFGRGPRCFICEECNEAAHDAYQEFLMS